MEDNIKILLEKLKISEDHYNYFLSSKLDKIKVNQKEKTCIIFMLFS